MAEFPATVPELLAWRAARDPSSPWLLFEGRSWTVPQVVEAVERRAAGLEERGVGPGDRVAIVLGNHPETIFAWFAANRLGAIAAILNPAYKPAELAGLFRLTTPRIVVTDEAHAPLVEAACASLEGLARPSIAGTTALASGPAAPPRVRRADARVSPDDVCMLIATSGTTGAPKAVMQTHRTYTLTAEAFGDWVGVGDSDRLLAALPLFHVNAQAYSTMAALARGSLALLGRFSASRFWEDARALGATQFNSVGAMLHILLRTAPRPADREHEVRRCYAALALPQATHRAFEERFGLTLSVGYGMSETTFGTVWPRGEPPRYGTMGRLRQHPRLGVVNRARVVRSDGTEAADGEAGELWLANPATMAGYWHDPVQSEAALRDGWLRTGDVVRRDADGWFTFVSRRKEMIRRRGENVAAAEIEAVLEAFPGVREVAVVGVPSDLGEEDIVAYVAMDRGATLDEAALVVWARERLADFKVPAVIHARDELPHTPTGRIAKHLLV